MVIRVDNENAYHGAKSLPFHQQQLVTLFGVDGHVSRYIEGAQILRECCCRSALSH